MRDGPTREVLLGALSAKDIQPKAVTAKILELVEAMHGQQATTTRSTNKPTVAITPDGPIEPFGFQWRGQAVRLTGPRRKRSDARGVG